MEAAASTAAEAAVVFTAVVAEAITAADITDTTEADFIISEEDTGTVGTEGGSSIAGAIISLILGIILLIVGIYLGKSPKTLKYSESDFQDLAINKYIDIYGENENCVLFVLMTSKDSENDGYWQISITGDNLAGGITEMFGGDTTTFGRAFDNALPKNYLNSLLPAYRGALETTANAITTNYTLTKRFYNGQVPTPVAPQYIKIRSI